MLSSGMHQFRRQRAEVPPDDGGTPTDPTGLTDEDMLALLVASLASDGVVADDGCLGRSRAHVRASHRADEHRATHPDQLELPLGDRTSASDMTDAELRRVLLGDDDGEISDLDRAVWDGPGRPPWRGPGPNYLARFRQPLTEAEYEAMLDEGARALETAIAEIFGDGDEADQTDDESRDGDQPRQPRAVGIGAGVATRDGT